MGATSDVYMRSNVDFTIAGQYYAEVKNGGGAVSSRTATLTVLSNNPPVASNDIYATPEDTSLTVSAPGVLANDADPDGDPLFSVLVSNVSHGDLSFSSDGGFIYTPATNYTGSDSFSYRANDGRATGNLATVTINVTPMYDSPVAIADATNTQEDVSVTIAVLANDYNPDATPLTITSTSTTNGIALISGSNVVFTPSSNFNGTVVFTYTISDGISSSSASVTVIVSAVNDGPPVANDDTYNTPEDTRLTVSANGILANDTDIDGDALTALLVTGVSHGALSLNPDGSFTYTPATNYNGSDSFTYRARDGSSTGNVATVTINVTPGYDSPVAFNDSTNTPQNVSIAIAVLDNDYNPDGTPLVITDTATTNGIVVIRGSDVMFPPATNFHGKTAFSYTISDGTSFSSANVIVTVDTPPAANGDVYTTAEEVPLLVPAPGILANDTDVDGDAFVPLLVTGVSHGTLTLNANGGFNYRPNTNYNGSDSFTYRLGNSFATGNVATVAINVTPVYDSPVAVNDSTSTPEDVSVLIRVLANDYNPDGAPLNISIGGVTNGTAIVSGTNILFTPATNFYGTVVFNYAISDGGSSSTGSVTVNVTPVNDAPVGRDDTFTTLKNVSLNIPAPGVLANDTDVEGDALTTKGFADVTHGVLSLRLDGSFTYTPNTNYVGADSFSYRPRDSVGNGNLSTVTIKVVEPNNALSFVSARMTTNGMELGLSGPSVSTFVILASPDFQNWSPISTNYTVSGDVVFTDTDAAMRTTRFYRAMLAP